MTDWKTMDAGRELDRVIAEHLNLGPVYSGDGEPFYPDYGWQDETGWIRAVPTYSTSVDVALTLPFPEGQYLYMALGATGRAWFEDSVWPAGGDGPVNTVTGLSPQVRIALAICRAWLAWHEARERGILPY